MATLLDGKSLAQKIRDDIREKVARLQKEKGITPGLATVLVGEDPASQVYVKNKNKACEEAGMHSRQEHLPATTSEAELLNLVASLNADPLIHGILVQLPLPKQINSQKILEAIDPKKDVDGFHPVNMGKLAVGKKGLRPCTPSGVIELLKLSGIELAGKDAVVVGRSNIVGKPVALMLLEANATVTVCHSKTKNLAEKIKAADVVVAALGLPHFLRGEWIKPGAVVIDVGINRLPDGRLVGDVEFEAARQRALAITPVPGGVGPMTIAMLLWNTLEAAQS